jgi:hypothetical protein
MVSDGATTHEGALTRQLPLLLEVELLDEVLLDELELLELELEELFKLDSPPQPATVSAPNALNACLRLK